MLDIQQTAAPETEPAVVCRPTGDNRKTLWITIALGAGDALGCLSLLFISPGSPWIGLGAGCFGVSFFILPFSIWAALYLPRAAIIADADSLRWRGAGRWRKASWAEVVSYSEYWPSSTSGKEPCLKIRSRRGTLLLYPGRWTAVPKLRETVQRNAAAAKQSGWLVTGAPQYLPLRCRYDTTINRNILGWVEKIHTYGLLAVAIYFAFQWVTTHTLPGWGWLLTPTGLFVVAKQTLPFLLRPTYRATQPRLADKVFADKDGLRFVTGGNDTQIAWADITDLYSLGIRSVIVTRDGGEYDFLDTLTDAERLKLVIPRLATNAGYRGWRTGTVRRQEIATSDGRQSVQHVYRYRSQNNCASLIGLTLAALFLATVAAGPALIAWQSGGVPGTKELSLATGGLLGLLAVFWLWGNYFRAAIRTTGEGITQQTLLGRRFLPWGQVRVFRWRGGADLIWGCLEGMSGTIIFWKGIGDAERLADEIAAHRVAVR